MAKDERAKALRAAYRDAWAARESTGDVSDAVLLRRLHLHGLFLEGEEAALFRVVLDAWRRGVPPNRLTWELAKGAGKAAAAVGSSVVAIARSFRGVRGERPDALDDEDE